MRGCSPNRRWFTAWAILWLISPALVFAGKSRSYPHVQDLSGTWIARAGEVGAASGEGMNLHGADWLEVEVPGNAVYQGLPDKEVYTFVKGFTPPRLRKGERLFVRFAAVDYAAEVWLNDFKLGTHVGYFQPFQFEIEPGWLKATGNQLVVQVSSFKEKDTLNKHEIKGVLSHHDTRPGGAWSARGSEQTTAGIWGAVTLRVTRHAFLEKCRLDYDLVPEKREAQSRFSVVVNHAGTRSRRFRLDIELRPLQPEGRGQVELSLRRKLDLAPGSSAVNLEPQIHAVAMWWPYELGKPALYEVTYRLFYRGECIDALRHEVGFRDIRWHADSQQWTVNGVRYFLRGTNYIGSLWLGQFTESEVLRDVLLMKQAHINAVRVHAHITVPSFYRACDREGLLIWQDFPLQWGYADSEAFTQAALSQAQDMVEGLGSHASIFAWCPHNEPPWDATWMTYKYPNYQAGQNKALDEALVTTLQMADSKRYVHPHSATFEHPWFGWYSGSWRDYGKPTSMTLISEFGAQALPGEETLRYLFQAKDLFPQTESSWEKWEYHNFQRKESFENARISRGETLQEFIHNTQTYQARLLQKAVESYRMQRFSPVSAIFQFMFVEHWPSINWGMVDYQRLPKPGWDALRRSYQPVLPLVVNPKEDLTSEIDPETLEVWIINDLPTSLKQASLQMSLGENRLPDWVHTWKVDVQADEKIRVGQVVLPSLSSGDYVLWLRLESASGNAIAVNQWPFQIRERGLP